MILHLLQNEKIIFFNIQNVSLILLHLNNICFKVYRTYGHINVLLIFEFLYLFQNFMLKPFCTKLGKLISLMIQNLYILYLQAINVAHKPYPLIQQCKKYIAQDLISVQAIYFNGNSVVGHFYIISQVFRFTYMDDKFCLAIYCLEYLYLPLLGSSINGDIGSSNLVMYFDRG